MPVVKSCELCGRSSFAPYRGGRYGTFVSRCLSCGLVFTNPQPTASELERAYGGAYLAAWLEPVQRERRRLLWERRFAAFSRIVPPGRVLDVGCGEGLFLAELRRRGYPGVGLELSAASAAYASRELKLDVRREALERAPLEKGSFDAVTFWHSLEHFPAPLAALERARELLRPGGRLVAAVPNVNDRLGGLIYRVYMGRRFPLYEPGGREPHLFHFSHATLRGIVEKAGFARIEIGTDFAQTDPAWGAVEKLCHRVSAVLGVKWQLALLVSAVKP